MHRLSQDRGRGARVRRSARTSRVSPGDRALDADGAGTPGPLRVVGRSVVRPDALDKVTGRARYASDLVQPGMLHALLLRSTHAHARIGSLDAAAARTVPGVHAVVTGRDLTWCDPYFGPAFRDRPMLA